jgi:hypothetical protein
LEKQPLSDSGWASGPQQLRRYAYVRGPYVWSIRLSICRSPTFGDSRHSCDRTAYTGQGNLPDRASNTARQSLKYGNQQ